MSESRSASWTIVAREYLVVNPWDRWEQNTSVPLTLASIVALINSARGESSVALREEDPSN